MAPLADPMHGLLTAIFRSIAAPVVVVRADGRILTANPAFTRLLDRPIGELIDRPFAAIMAGDSPAPAGEAIAPAGGQEQELRLLRADATPLRLAASWVAIDQPALGQLAVITLREPPPAATGAAAGHAAGQTDPAIQAIQQRLPRGVVVSTGRIQIVRLDEARATLGERWAAVSGRMLRTAEHVIERRLGEREVFSRTADGDFVICLTDAPENEIRFRAEAIEQEVLRALLGEDAPARVVRVEAPEPESTAPHALARAELEAAMACDGVTRLLHPTDGAVPSRAWISPRPETLRRINRALTALPPDDPDRLLPDTLGLVLAVRSILADDRQAGPRPSTIVTAIDYEAAASRRRMARITDACRTLPAGVRQQLHIMLTGVPRGVAPGRLVETVQTLRPLCRAVGVVVEDLAALPLAPLLHPGTLIGIDLADLQKLAALQDGTLERIARQLHQHQGALLALGAAVPDDLPRLRALGVDLAGE